MQNLAHFAAVAGYQPVDPALLQRLMTEALPPPITPLECEDTSTAQAFIRAAIHQRGAQIIAAYGLPADEEIHRRLHRWWLGVALSGEPTETRH